MMGIQASCECRRQHDDCRDGRREGQAADEQSILRSTIHRRIPISMRALGSGAHHELGRISHAKRSSLSCRLFPLPILGARAQARRREQPSVDAAIRSASGL